jgi:hypothetical protein
MEKEIDMDDKKQHQEEIRRLTFVVVFMSLFVIMLFGLGPLM